MKNELNKEFNEMFFKTFNDFNKNLENQIRIISQKEKDKIILEILNRFQPCYFRTRLIELVEEKLKSYN